MCVIAVMDGTRPTEKQVEEMYETNPSGAGIAWREDTPKGVVVRWRKGLKLGEIQDLIKTVPLPAIAHFRIPTCGGDGPEMNHPFDVSVKSCIDLHGNTKGYMLFHNGHWGQWKSTVLETAIKTGKQLPGGRWSDSRGMAWVAAIYGIGALELIDEKCAVISPTNLEVFGNGWSKVTDGLWVSNKFWEKGTTRYSYGGYSGTMCRETRCTKPKVEGKDYCEEHVGFTKKANPPKPQNSTVSSGECETKGEPGGASPEATFRSDSETPQSGETVKQEVQESQGEVCESNETNSHHERETEEAPEVIDAETVSHSLRTEEDRVKAIEFVRSLNPSKFRRPLDPSAPPNPDRLARQAAFRQGIIHLGKL